MLRPSERPTRPGAKAGAADAPATARPVVREFHYRIGAPVLGHFPGHHRSTRGESGFEFRGHASLLDAPDPRRLDLHASLRDPFGNWIVRVHSQRKSIPVVMLADLSASMSFEGGHRKQHVVADFAESLAWSAWRTGDSFGFIGCDSVVRNDLLVPQTRSSGRGTVLARALRALPLQGRSADGLLRAHEHLPRQRSLVFLVSDFHFPVSRLQLLLASLAHHDVVPVVVWDPLEFGLTAHHGLVHAVDAESGRRRLVWWRPAVRDKWRRQHEARRAELLAIFRAQRLKPLFVEGPFRADDVTRHFHS
jgi:hypothetical protein